jgi:vancomycin resistance protein YoaR
LAVAEQQFTLPSTHPRARMTAPERTGRSHFWPIVTIVSLFMVVVVSPLVALGFYEYEQADRVYRGVSALGIDLSGLDRTDAEQLVAARAAELTARPVLVRAGDSEWPTDWHRLGLDMPVGPIVDKAIGVGRQGSVLDRLYGQARALRSGVAIPVEETLDETTIRAFVATAGEHVDRPVRNARLDMQPDLTFVLTTAQAGQALDQDAAVKLLLAASQTGVETVEIPVLSVQPTTTDEMRLPAKEKAEKILAGPLTVTGGEKTWTIDKQALASALVFTGGPGVPIEVGLDADKLRPTIDKIAAEVVQEPKDATVEWVNGALRATAPGQDGQRMDADAALKQVAAAAESGARSVTLPLSVTKPAVDANNLDALGVKELIDSASTSFAGGLPEKIHNVKLAASRLNNQLIAPGAKFSFNKALGPTTLDNGYQVAYGIESSGDSGHKTVPSVAGGICQVATTLFQPVFWSGYQLEERHWHLYWIPAYASKGGAVGLDATVDEEVNLDLQFVNNSNSYLLIHTKTDDSTVTFELYGTKPDWTVKVDGPTIADQKKADPTPVTEREPSLPAGKTIQVEAARDGFTASFVRNVTAKDGNVRTLQLRSDYVPSQNVTLVGTGGQTAEAPARSSPVADGA